MKRYIHILILLIINLTLLMASPMRQSIRGRVLDKITGYPLPGATVILSHSDPIVGVTTNNDGIFELKNVALGRQSLVVQYMGYQPKTIKNLLVSSAKEVYIEIELEERVSQIKELTISSHKSQENALNPMAAVSARSVRIEDTERFAGSFGDPARMVSNFAGVVSQNDMRNDIIIRGNSPMGLLWRLEGMEIPNPNHFAAMGTTGGPVSILNNNLLTQSDFITGAFPAEFGNVLSGVFDLNMRSGNNKRHEYTAQVGFNGFELGAEGPFKQKESGMNASYMANFRYSTLDVINKLGFDLGTGFAIPKYKDLTFIVDVPGKKYGRLKIIGLWGNSLMELGRGSEGGVTTGYVSRNTATDFGTEIAFTGVTHLYYFNERSRIKSTLSTQYALSETRYDSVYTNPAKTVPVYRGTQRETKLSLTSEYRHKISSRNNYSLGVILDKYLINYTDSANFPELQRFVQTLDIKGNVNVARCYLQWQHHFNSKLSLNSGVYAQYFDLNEQWILEPRLSLKWAISKTHSLAWGYGKHSQAQAKSIYYHQFYHSPTDTYSYTNKDLKMSRSDHYVMSYHFMPGREFRVKAEGYYQYLYDIPGKKNQGSAYDNQFSLINAGVDFTVPKENFLDNNVIGENYGLELTIEKFLSKGYYVLLTTSLFESKYKPQDGIWRNTAFNGNYVLNLLIGYEIQIGEKSMLTFDFRSVYAGGRRYVPYDLEASLHSGSAIKDWDNAYNAQYAPYFRNDVRIGFKFNHRKVSMEWGLDLQNVSNHKNIFQIDYDVNRNETYEVYQQGFFPMMLYRIQF